MGKHNLETLKRAHICSILKDNKWDYKSSTKLSVIFSKCLHEIISWHYRRGNKLTPHLIQTVCETICVKEGLTGLDSANVCGAVQKFITSVVYKKLQNPILGYEGMMRVGKQNTLTYSIPVMDETEKGFTVMITNPIYKTPEELANSFEARFMSVWFFYGRNRYVDIHNVYYENGEYRTVHYQPSEKNVREAKKVINNMERLFYDYNYAAPTELCLGCDRRSECPIHRTKK